LPIQPSTASPSRPSITHHRHRRGCHRPPSCRPPLRHHRRHRHCSHLILQSRHCLLPPARRPCHLTRQCHRCLRLTRSASARIPASSATTVCAMTAARALCSRPRVPTATIVPTADCALISLPPLQLDSRRHRPHHHRHSYPLALRHLLQSPRPRRSLRSSHLSRRRCRPLPLAPRTPPALPSVPKWQRPCLDSSLHTGAPFLSPM
jgi:hypothetical protein